MADDPAQQDASEFSRWIGHNSSAIQRTPAQRVATRSVENFPGAGSTIGTADGARAAPDGYTLVLAGSGSLAISPTLYKELPYDPRKDFKPIALVVRVPFILVVNPSLPIESVTDLISYAKAHPGALTYGSGGAASTLCMCLTKAMIVGADLRRSADEIGASESAGIDVSPSVSLTENAHPRARLSHCGP